MLPSNIFLQHSHIWIDLDETLASTVSGVLAHAHSQGKLLTCQTIDEVNFYDFTLIDPTLTLQDASTIWEEYGKLTLHPESVPLVPGAEEWMALLLQAGKEISIVTARSDQESWKVERTLRWIENHFPHISQDKVAFVNHFYHEARPKSVACKERGVTLMIDDSMENAHDLVGAWIACVLLDRPWNQWNDFFHPLLHRVKNWDEINSYLKHLIWTSN